MKKLLTVAAGLVLLLAAARAAEPEAPPAAPGSLRVMSYNIRNSGAKDGVNQWSNRREMFFGRIRAFNPDLLGTQEVLADQHDELLAAFPAYGPVGVARTDGVRKGEWSLILFRQERFEAGESGTFWLSPSPEVVGSKGWDAALERICSWVKLKDRTNGRTLIYANTHFDHKGPQARTESAKLLRSKLAAMAGQGAVILTGDFNSTEDTEAYQTLVAKDPANGFQLIDSYREVHPERSPEEASFNSFKGGTAGSRIDWILHSSQYKAVSAEIDRTAVEGHFPSDHYSVNAVLEPK